MDGYVATAKKLFFPELLYLPILLFDFGTSPQTIPVLLRQDHFKEILCEVSSQKVFYRNNFLYIGTDRSEQTVQTQIRLLLMEQSDQGLLCLLFCLHLLNTILHCKIQLFQL